jgi:hypothetical protein
MDRRTEWHLAGQPPPETGRRWPTQDVPADLPSDPTVREIKKKMRREKQEKRREDIYLLRLRLRKKKKKRKGNGWVGGRGGTNGKRDGERRRKEQGNI